MKMYPEADIYALMYDANKSRYCFPPERIRCDTPAQTLYRLTGSYVSLPLMPASIKKSTLPGMTSWYRVRVDLLMGLSLWVRPSIYATATLQPAISGIGQTRYSEKSASNRIQIKKIPPRCHQTIARRTYCHHTPEPFAFLGFWSC